MTERGCALREVMEKGFALDDALLYLDTHPCDREALCYFQQQQAEYAAAKARYSTCFGPLQMEEAAQAERHVWVNTPWPWEGEE